MSHSVFVFFFKQKTAYEMRISDWSSDVCSSDLDPEELARGHAEGVFTAAKLYPAHATTGSAHGVTDIAAIRPVLEQMQAIGMPLLIHGEVTDADVDIFDREAVFIERTLAPLVRDFPALKNVLEHITTAEAAAFVADEIGRESGGDSECQYV